ncbi:MAG: hypothetical protein PHU26_08370 [Methanofollis liminatans]|nr:hypothetical protein [Methanofollis liminatans]
MTEKDDAVSTVIALMLILGIIVTLIAIYSATYLPGLKQQSEIEHSRAVVDAFVRFGSDIDYVVSHKTKARFNEPFSLGGGDVLLSPVRSSGSLTIGEEQPLVNVTVVNGTHTGTGAASLVNVSYVPSFTIWEPQGYRWEYGFVAVTKNARAVPQSSRYDTMDEALENSSVFLRSFLEQTPSDDGLVITLVHLFPNEGESFMTGSGTATLGLNATAGEGTISLAEATSITFDPKTPLMQDYLDEMCGRAAADTGSLYVPGSNVLEFTDHPVNVTLRTVNVEVSVC